MGPMYEYCAAFRHDGAWPNWVDVARSGFRGLWSRFGAPRILLVFDYMGDKQDERPYSDQALVAAMPPGATEFVNMYSRVVPAGRVLVSFGWEGPYIAASASVYESEVEGPLRRELFDEFTVSLRRFGPLVMIAGDEALRVDEALIDRIMAGASAPIRERSVEYAISFASMQGDRPGYPRTLVRDGRSA